MAADVEEGAQALVAATDDKDRDVAHAGAEKLARVLRLLGRAGVLATPGGNALLLPRQRLRVGVPGPRQGRVSGSGAQTGPDYTRRR